MLAVALDVLFPISRWRTSRTSSATAPRSLPQSSFPTCIAAGKSLQLHLFVVHTHKALPASCVHTIEDSLSSLSPAPSSIDVSIVTQTVTVKHTPELSPYDIKAAIDAAGFDIVATPSPATGTTRTPLSFTHTIARIPAILTGKSDKHLQQCAACQEERRAALEFESSSSPHVVEREKFGEDTLTGDPEIKKVPLSGHPSVRLDHESEHGPQRVTLSVGGMTCASCSNAVTHALSELPGISDACPHPCRDHRGHWL